MMTPLEVAPMPQEVMAGPFSRPSRGCSGERQHRQHEHRAERPPATHRVPLLPPREAWGGRATQLQAAEDDDRLERDAGQVPGSEGVPPGLHDRYADRPGHEPEGDERRVAE